MDNRRIGYRKTRGHCTAEEEPHSEIVLAYDGRRGRYNWTNLPCHHDGSIAHGIVYGGRYDNTVPHEAAARNGFIQKEEE